jgi:glycine reductase complex component B subunit gamma
VIAVEIEKVGIPTAQITTMTPVALMVNANRIIPGNGIVHPLGNARLNPKAEKELRRAIVEKALQALEMDITEKMLFARPF